MFVVDVIDDQGNRTEGCRSRNIGECIEWMDTNGAKGMCVLRVEREKGEAP